MFIARARSTDPETSYEAAGKINGQGLCERVVDEMHRGGPGTAHEIAERMGLALVTISPRMKPLEEAGKVTRCGRRDGRTVWALVP